MKDGRGPNVAQKPRKRRDLGLGARERSGIIARRRGFARPVLRGKVAVQIDAMAVGAFIRESAIGIQARNQQPRMEVPRGRGAQGAQEVLRQTHALGLVAVDTADKEQRSAAIGVRFLKQLEAPTLRALTPSRFVQNSV